jgi:hypothetical protein
MRVRSWLKTVPTLVIIGSILFLVLAVGGGLLLWGANFADDMVHKQLSEQNITFPEKGSAALSPEEFPGLQQYAGQAVDNGPKAKAYADQYIRKHLEGVAGGKTYSEVSGEVQAARGQGKTPDPQLVAQQDTLFRGETLRGLLLYAWGWATVGLIAFWAGIAALIGAGVVFLALVIGFVVHEHDQKHTDTDETAEQTLSLTDDSQVPMGVG